MPWFFTIPEFIKKRACRYLLQHYLGQFLEEKISLNDLTVDLYNGTGTISNVPLNVEAINEALQSTGAPLKVVSGYIGRVTVSVPWSALLKENCKVEISGLAVSIAPYSVPYQNDDEQVSMTDSLFFNMTSSRQLAEEVLKGGASDDVEGGVPAAGEPSFEGMEALAKAIELVLARVQVSLLDTVVQVNYRTADLSQDYFLKLRVQRVEFYDELSKVESSVDVGGAGGSGGEGEGERGSDEPPQMADFSVKALKLSGLLVELGNEQVQEVKLDQSLNETLMVDTSLYSSSLLDPELHGVPVAKASGQVTVRVKLKQNENVVGPKLEVDGFLGSLHLLFSPQQLSMLLEMSNGILNEVQQPPGFEKMRPGQSRPILKGDLKTIESQLARHQLNEQKAKAQKLQREDLFHADPWNNSLGRHEPSSALVDSTVSTNEEFYSLDLTHSYSGSISTGMTQSVTQTMEESFTSTMSHVSSLDTYMHNINHGHRAPSTISGRSEFSTSTVTGRAGISGGSSGGVGVGGGAHIYGRSIASDLESIPLHEGVGLQQLSQSPPSLPSHHHHNHYHHHHHASGHHLHTGTSGSPHQGGGGASLYPTGDSLHVAPHKATRTDGGGRFSSVHSSESATHRRQQQQHTDSHHHYDVCKYSFTVSGITLALLEADPMHVHSTPFSTVASESPSLVRRGSPHSSQSSLNSNHSNTNGSLSSVDEGGLDPLKYFETVSGLLEEGINRKVFQAKQEELAQVLPNDHLLLWLSTVKVNVDVEGPRLSVDLSMVSAELWEYLYRNQAMINHITKPVSVSPIVQLIEDSYPSPKPCLKIKLCSTTSSENKRRGHPGEVHTVVEASLTTAQINADVTLLDRLQPLLAAPSRSKRTVPLRSNSLEKMKHSLYMTSSNVHTIGLQRQAVFNQAISADSSHRKEHRLNLRAKCNTVNFSLRFPVPNLKNSKQPPWYQSTLRNEVLFLSVSDVGLSTQLTPPALAGEATYTVDAYFNTAKAYLSCDGSAQSRQLFLTINKPSSSPSANGSSHLTSLHHVPNCTNSDPVDTASISVVVQPVPESVLAQVGRKGKLAASSGAVTTAGTAVFDYTRHDSLEAEIELRKSEPLPFSSKRSMFSTGKAAQSYEGDSEEMHSRELVMPGSTSEMTEFEQHAINLAQYSVLCTLPLVSVHLPSKRFMQTLYHRFAMDLTLWKPATPSSVEKANAKSMLFSCMDVLQPAATQEDRFEMCKSVLKEEESEEDTVQGMERLSPPFNEEHGVVQNGGLSQLAFSLSIERAKLTILTEVNEALDPIPKSDQLDSNIFHSTSSDGHLLDLGPKCTTRSMGSSLPDTGLVYSDLSNIHLFSVSGYKGDPTLDYFCAKIQDFSMSHVGSLDSVSCSAFSCVEDSADHSLLDELCPIVYRARNGPTHKTTAVGASQEPLFSVAMEMKLDKERNSMTNKCAVGLQNATIAYHMTTPEHNCFKQLADFFDFGEEEVEGYEPPSLITELHVHLTSCSVEYRPLYLPLHVFLSFDSVSLSTNLVTGAPVLVLKLVVDGTYLSLANRQSPTVVGVASSLPGSFPPPLNHVCVLEMEWFELTLRLCDNSQFAGDYQKLFSRLPDISMECSSNVVHLRTCTDSCIALRDLILYLAKNGDLHKVATDENGEIQLRDYSTLGSDVNPSQPSSLSGGDDGGLPLSSENGNIGHLINDAMEDIIAPISAPSKTTPTSRIQSRSKKPSNNKNKMKKKKVAASSQSKPKMEIHVSGDNSIVMDFNSDTDEDDDDDDILRDLMSHHRSRRSASNGSGGEDKRLRDSLSPSSSSSTTFAAGKSMKQSGSDYGSIFSESDEDFCFVDAPTITKVAPGARPQVKCLLEKGETLEFVENHFTIPDRRTDQLQRPKHFPEPVFQYTLKEMTVIWHMYGGRDFQHPADLVSTGSSPSSSPHMPQHLTKDSHHLQGVAGQPGLSQDHFYSNRTRQVVSGNERTTRGSNFASASSRNSLPSSSPRLGRSHSGSSSSVAGNCKKKTGGKRPPSDWRVAGGPGRDHSVLMELELDKLRIQHETYPKNTEQSSQFTLLINDLEIRDRLTQSQINKFLYQYTTEAMPRQSHANMVSLKVLFTRPELDSRPDIEEASVRLSILPIRLNMDQDAVLFVSTFLRQLGETATLECCACTLVPVPSLDDAGTVDQRTRSGSCSSNGSQSPVIQRSNQEVFIRSFIFQPELPIRIDYEAKGFKTEMGTLAGILLGLSHLNNSEVKLKALTYKKGLLGWDKLLDYASNEWVQDIRNYQLPHILKGVGPMHHVTQLVYGVLDLVRLPYYQYQEDGRILWGLQRGATAFTSSTGVAVVELTSRMLETVQSFAQMAYDLVAPSERTSDMLVHQHKPHEPLDLREGFANAYDVVYAGIGNTATDMYTVATKEHEERGVTGAVGGVLRQLPGTFVKPIILASEATRHMLGGVKNQFVPDARKEASEKWKSATTTD